MVYFVTSDAELATWTIVLISTGAFAVVVIISAVTRYTIRKGFAAVKTATRDVELPENIKQETATNVWMNGGDRRHQKKKTPRNKELLTSERKKTVTKSEALRTTSRIPLNSKEEFANPRNIGTAEGRGVVTRLPDTLMPIKTSSHLSGGGLVFTTAEAGPGEKLLQITDGKGETESVAGSTENLISIDSPLETQYSNDLEVLSSQTVTNNTLCAGYLQIGPSNALCPVLGQLQETAKVEENKEKPSIPGYVRITSIKSKCNPDSPSLKTGTPLTDSALHKKSNETPKEKEMPSKMTCYPESIHTPGSTTAPSVSLADNSWLSSTSSSGNQLHTWDKTEAGYLRLSSITDNDAGKEVVLTEHTPPASLLSKPISSTNTDYVTLLHMQKSFPPTMACNFQSSDLTESYLTYDDICTDCNYVESSPYKHGDDLVPTVAATTKSGYVESSFFAGLKLS